MSKDTPSFNGTDYKWYRQLAKIWATVSTVSEEHKAMTLIMFLKDKALDIALTIDETPLKTKKADAPSPETKVGVELLIAKLDEIYLESDDTLGKYERFENIRRISEQRMTEFILIFESLERELKTEGVTLPELVLAYKLLKAANLSNADEKLARATCTAMTMEDMKKSLMRLDDSQLKKSKAEGSDSLPIKVKTEPCYLASNNGQLPTEASEKETTDSNNLPEEEVMFNRNRPGNNARGKQQRPFGQRNDNRPVCYGCHSPGHWIRDCPLRAPFRPPMNFQRPPYQQHSMPYNQQPMRYMQRPNNQQPGYRQGPPNPAYYNQQIPYYLSDMIPNNEEFYGYDQEYYEEPTPTGKPIFFQSNVGQEEEAVFLVGETVNKALLDSGASRTVAGGNWYSCFLDSLDDKTRSTVKEFPAELIFRFGVGTLESSKKVIIPVTICTHEIQLEVHIVNSDIPLLLSLMSMKNMGVQLNFETDTVTIRGEDYKLELTESGHYVIPIQEENVKFESILIVEERSQEIDSKKQANKLHKRFAHASSGRIVKLLKNAGVEAGKLEALEENLKNLEKTCEFCLTHMRAHPRPKVSLPMANSFNELVAIDLKEIEGKWILHAIDYLTRFSSAAVLENKTSEEVIDKFFTIWISMFGPPQRILSDNGGEFVSYAFESLCESFDIKQQTTAAEAPFSNGVCERHNSLIGDMTEKVFHDVKCPLNVALMWAVHAKNTLINIHGFSPYQLVFGTNPNIPGVSSSNLPALEGTTPSQIVANHLNSLHKAREAYIKVENSDRLRRALIGRVYEGTHQRFLPGDTVYFKRTNTKEWHGPAKVIGQDGTSVLVKNGGLLVKVHPCKMVLKQEADNQLNHKERSRAQETNSDDTSTQRDFVTPDLDPENISAQGEPEIQTITRTTSQEEPQEISTNNLPGGTAEPTIHVETAAEVDIEDTPEPTIERTPTEVEQTKQPPKARKPIMKNKKGLITAVSEGDTVVFKEPDSDTWNKVQQKSRGYTVNSINKNYWNVISEDGRASGVNLDKVDWLLKKDPPLIVEPNENEETIKFAEMISEEVFVLRTSPNKSENFEQSREVEIQSWKNFGVYKEVNKNDYPSHIPLSCTWVESEKENNGHKSRLCIRGFEEENPPKADSPTAGKDTLRMFLGLAAANSWKIEMIDIHAAFLQSDPLDRVILLKPPKQFRKDSDTLWLLLKPVYGLNDASRCWFLTAKRLLEKLGCKCLSLDYSVYIYHDSEGKLAGFLVIHVDDFLVGGNSEFKRNVIDELMKILKISCREQDNFRYIGWDISQNEDGIEIDQNAYKEVIETVKISNHRRNQPDHELSDYEKKQYQQVLGQLTWITSQSRPDVRFKVLECSLKSNKPTVADLIQINQVVLKLKKTSYNIHLPILSKDPSKYNIMAFSDASVNNLKPDRVESTKASIIFLECDGKVIPLTWSSKKIKRVCKEILLAECIALSSAVDQAAVMRDMLIEAIHGDTKKQPTDFIPITVYTDSYSLFSNIHSDKRADNLKMRREVAAIRQQIAWKEIKCVKWVPDKLQLADCLTKTTGSPTWLISVLQSGTIPSVCYN